MDRAEIIKELKQQITQSIYLSECSANAGMRTIHRKKADFLFGLQREIEALQSELEQVKAERDTLKVANDGLCISHDNTSKRLAEALVERDKAIKCITDVETYMDLGSGKFAYNTIQRWRGMEGR